MKEGLSSNKFWFSLLLDAAAAEALRSGRGGPKHRITRSLRSLHPNNINYTIEEEMSNYILQIVVLDNISLTLGFLC